MKGTTSHLHLQIPVLYNHLALDSRFLFEMFLLVKD